MPIIGRRAKTRDGQPDGHLDLGHQLRKRLDEEPPPTLMTDQMDQVRARFIEAVEGLGDQDHLVAEQNHQAHVASLKEAIRQLLLLAAYVELAQTANRGLFDEGDDLPLDFSKQAIRRLKRHKSPSLVPWSSSMSPTFDPDRTIPSTSGFVTATRMS